MKRVTFQQKFLIEKLAEESDKVKEAVRNYIEHNNEALDEPVEEDKEIIEARKFQQ